MRPKAESICFLQYNPPPPPISSFRTTPLPIPHSKEPVEKISSVFYAFHYNLACCEEFCTPTLSHFWADNIRYHDVLCISQTARRTQDRMLCFFSSQPNIIYSRAVEGSGAALFFYVRIKVLGILRFRIAERIEQGSSLAKSQNFCVIE